MEHMPSDIIEESKEQCLYEVTDLPDSPQMARQMPTLGMCTAMRFVTSPICSASSYVGAKHRH
jgi:hypothetical protein